MSSLRISRRTALRGLGATIALPVFESLGVGTDQAEPPMRLLFVYAPNGKLMADLALDGATLEPLAKLKDRVALLSGLCLRNADPGLDGPGDHARAMAAFLTGVRPNKTSGSDVRVGVSVDQVAAADLGKRTRFPSLEVGCEGGKPAGTCDNGYSCAYQTNLSWRTATQPMPKEIDPRRVFERLFGDPANPRTDARDRNRRSILEFVAEDTKDLAGNLSGSDRQKLDEYLTAVREVERRIQTSQPTAVVGNKKLVRPTGVPEKFQDHARLLADLVTLAFQTDQTRVVTFVLGNDGSNRSYREVGVPDGHHDVSHHGNDPEKLDKVRKINRLHIAQLGYLLDKLHTGKEGTGSLLDRCLVVYGSGIRDGDKHDHDDLPILIAGGGVRGGRTIRYPTGTPLCNLHLELLHRVGMTADRFGDSTGRLGRLDG
jgi:hypothetical protein